MTQKDTTKPRCDNCPAWDVEDMRCHLSPNEIPTRHHHWCAQHPEIQRQFHEIKTANATKEERAEFLALVKQSEQSTNDAFLACLEGMERLTAALLHPEPKTAPVVTGELHFPCECGKNMDLRHDGHLWVCPGCGRSLARRITPPVVNLVPKEQQGKDNGTMMCSDESGPLHSFLPYGPGKLRCVKCGLVVTEFPDPPSETEAQPIKGPLSVLCRYDMGAHDWEFLKDYPSTKRCRKCYDIVPV